MSKIAETAYNILGENIKPPINIEAIVKNRGINLVYYDFRDDGISGILIIENGSATIGVNQDHPPVRKRFTIAHELGHFELHKGKDLFVDKGFSMWHRSSKSDLASQRHEKEANEFAASILMPEKLLRSEIGKFELDYTDEETIDKLAKTFDVSTIAMSFRISNLFLKK